MMDVFKHIHAKLKPYSVLHTSINLQHTDLAFDAKMVLQFMLKE